MTARIRQELTIVGLLAIGVTLPVGCRGPVFGGDRRPRIIKPAALRPGDTIAIVAPAGPLERERIELAARRLRELGFVVRLPADICRRRGYLAGDDHTRAAELMAAFADPQVRAIFPGTGGYGTTRILDLLDYGLIRRNPKVLIGFSDITALHVAIHQRTGLVTFHSPVPMWGLGSRENLDPLAARYFWRALRGPGPDEPAADGAGYSLQAPPGSFRTIAGGVARGRLTGGNLSLLAALMGTPYEIQTDGAVLFLEDVGEEPYRIDRYLSQLRLAGKLDHLAAVVLGRFSRCKPDEPERSLTLEQVFDDYFADLGVPVLAGFPVGHVRQNVTLPYGVLVEVDADAGTLRVLEEPVLPAAH